MSFLIFLITYTPGASAGTLKLFFPDAVNILLPFAEKHVNGFSCTSVDEYHAHWQHLLLVRSHRQC
jgi:hypothetical protein